MPVSRNPVFLRRSGENGFVLVLALMVLLVLTLLGTLSLKSANTEVLTAGARQGSLASFYLLEAVALTGAVQLENQNVGGDCLDGDPGRCPAAALHDVDAAPLAWLAAVRPEDASRPVFDLSVLDPAAAADDGVVPRIRKFPDNWVGAGRRTARLPAELRESSGGGLEPPGYVDVEDGGTGLIRYAVQDHGRVGVYSIGAGDPVVKRYEIYGLYRVGEDARAPFPGTFAVEMGYRMELEPLEVM